jgi:hypothetical protein
MICVKVTTRRDFWFTKINATIEEAREYFLGRIFERHDDPIGDTVISVEEIK